MALRSVDDVYAGAQRGLMAVGTGGCPHLARRSGARAAATDSWRLLEWTGRLQAAGPRSRLRLGSGAWQRAEPSSRPRVDC